MRRKITRRFEEWKASGDRKKCLVVRGARQIGKTYSIEEFAKENYGHYLRIDLHKDVGARTMFDGDLDAGTIMMAISARYPRFEFVPGNTLLFLDEIQDCPNARTALKFLSRNENFDIVRQRYMNGLALITDMLDASNTQLDMELQLANYQAGILYQYFLLKKQIGTL